jgi:hypothetical protein
MAAWLDLLLDDPKVIMLMAALPSVASGMWICYRTFIERKDKRREADETRDMTRDERRARELDAQQSNFSTEQMRWFGDLRQELKDKNAELVETRRDRERGWDLARFWHGMAHDLLRDFRNLRHNALNMQSWINSAITQYGVAMPVSIDPVPDRPDIPMGLEDPLANVLPVLPSEKKVTL